MIPILFWVLVILSLILYPWPGSPWAAWPWGAHILYVVLFVLLGIAVFGFGVGGRI